MKTKVGDFFTANELIELKRDIYKQNEPEFVDKRGEAHCLNNYSSIEIVAFYVEQEIGRLKDILKRSEDKLNRMKAQIAKESKHKIV